MEPSDVTLTALDPTAKGAPKPARAPAPAVGRGRGEAMITVGLPKAVQKQGKRGGSVRLVRAAAPCGVSTALVRGRQWVWATVWRCESTHDFLPPDRAKFVLFPSNMPSTVGNELGSRLKSGGTAVTRPSTAVAHPQGTHAEHPCVRGYLLHYRVHAVLNCGAQARLVAKRQLLLRRRAHSRGSSQ